MNKKFLSQIYYLKKEIKTYQDRIFMLKEKATSTTQTMSDMPKGSSKSDKVGNYAVKIAELQKLIEIKEHDIITAETEIQKYINNIDDSLIRLIIYYRNIRCFSWGEVARHIGGINTTESVRKMYKRFLDSH